MSKIYILDTNVILHDPSSFKKFKKNRVVIPISVIEEIDNFKKGQDILNFNARQFIRMLDELESEDENITEEKGVNIGDDLGYLKINTKDVADKFLTNLKKTTDNDILALCLYYIEKYKEDEKIKIILVTKDINLRIKAKAYKIKAQDFKNDKVEESQLDYKGLREINDFDFKTIKKIYSEKNISEEVFNSFLNDNEKIINNESFLLKNGSSSVLVRHNTKEKKLFQVDSKNDFYGITSQNKEQQIAFDLLTDKNIDIVTISGNAGTGKTLLALAAALHQTKDYKQIYLARPIVPLSNKDMGFLPGSIEEKLQPYMEPLFDNLKVIKNTDEDRATKITQMLHSKKIQISPLAYIRGRSLPNIYFIVDESQSLSALEMKTIITRLGKGSKIVFTGDIHQIDNPYLDTHSNGLTHIMSKFKNQKCYGHITLTKGERSPLAELASKIL